MDPVSILQLKASGWMGSVVDLLPLGYAFGAGMMSTVNPCGFALLPTYLALYLGANEGAFEERAWPLRVARALLVAGVVTLGFVLLFGVIGAGIAAGGRFLMTAMPWVALVIGFGLIVLGLWMLSGRHLSADVFRRLSTHVGDPREAGVRGFFLYGITYALCSLSCTLPVFLVVVGSAVAASGFFSALAQFVSYALGMGLVILVLTLGVALFKQGLVMGGARRVMPYLQPATAVFVTLAGAYIVYYWLFKFGLLSGDPAVAAGLGAGG